MSETALPVNDESQRLHEAAIAILTAEKRPHTEDNYVDAVARAQQQDSLPIRAAMEELGLGFHENVTTAMLQARANEILKNPDTASERQRIEAFKQAINEIGAPGQPRRDSDRIEADAFDQLTHIALVEGALVESSLGVVRGMRAKDPEQAFSVLSTLIDSRRAAKAAFSPGGVEPDNESFDLHARAEQILEANGAARSREGKLEYEEKAYLDALGKAQDEFVRAGGNVR